MGVRQEVIDAIDATEPYKAGKGHALWQLKALNNPDKHELLLRVATFPLEAGALAGMVQRMAADMPASVPEQVREAWARISEKAADFSIFTKPPITKPLEVSEEIYSESLNTKPIENRKFRFHVSLNELGVIQPEPATKTLQDMTNLVRSAVETLGKFLPP